MLAKDLDKIILWSFLEEFCDNDYGKLISSTGDTINHDSIIIFYLYGNESGNISETSLSIQISDYLNKLRESKLSELL